MIRAIKGWLRARRQRHFEREAKEWDETIRQAWKYRRYNPFIASVLDFNRRRGYMTPKQYRALRRAVKSEIAISHGA